MSDYVFIISLLPLGIWLKLVLGQGGFWRERPDDRQGVWAPERVWPSVVAVVPARNEADVIATSIGSLLAQTYPGPFEIILVDDQSTDGTAEIARGLVKPPDNRLHIIGGSPLPAGWVGKIWAVAQGVGAARHRHPDGTYLWLTDADIGHEPDNLLMLVTRAENGHLDLVTQMVRLDPSSLGENFLSPAFVYFFAMLYPFTWVNTRQHKMAAAAGGSMLVRQDALIRSGGIEGIRQELIDDCALARQIKSLSAPSGGIHLSLTDKARSLRSYGGFFGVGRMVARSAYTQLSYQPLALVGTVLGLAITFMLPLVLVLAGGPAAVPALITYGLMVLSFGPILEVYRLSPLYALTLPLVAIAYMGFTLKSALDHWRGRGGRWKGRVQASANNIDESSL